MPGPRDRRDSLVAQASQLWRLGAAPSPRFAGGALALSSACSDREEPGGSEGAGNAAGDGDHEERPDPPGGRRAAARHLLREERERPGAEVRRRLLGASAMSLLCVRGECAPSGPAAPTPAHALLAASRRRLSRTSLGGVPWRATVFPALSRPLLCCGLLPFLSGSGETAAERPGESGDLPGLVPVCGGHPRVLPALTASVAQLSTSPVVYFLICVLRLSVSSLALSLNLKPVCRLKLFSHTALKKDVLLASLLWEQNVEMRFYFSFRPFLRGH